MRFEEIILMREGGGGEEGEKLGEREKETDRQTLRDRQTLSDRQRKGRRGNFVAQKTERGEGGG